MSGPRIRPVGDRGVLLELPNNEAVHFVARFAREHYEDQLIDVVPGHTTLLLTWHAGGVMSDFSELAACAVASSEKSPHDATGKPPAITVPINYSGADLDAIAARLGMSTEAVAELHSATEYVVAFMGFAPGFPYLVADTASLSEQASRLLELPRLETPRTVVPAGSVAVAAGYCGIYPWSSPGGWNLLGRTDVVLFHPEREQPALLEPGMRVRFEAV